MRLALLVHDYSRTGGHSRYVAALAERFAARHEVHVFANRYEERPPPGIHTHHVPALRAGALATVLSFPAGLAGRLRRFDLVHAQGFCILDADVVTAHICNARWLEARRRSAPGRLWRDRLFALPVVALERRVFRRDRTSVIAVSDVVRRDITHYYGRRGPSTVIHHGVDLAQFNPDVAGRHRAGVRRELGLAHGEVVLLYVGDLRKGASTLVDAAAGVPEVTVLLVSRSDPAPWLAHARARGLDGRVRIVAPTDRIERYYGAADVFVLPTPYDAFGMVVTEAMACGLPVVTTRAAGASEVITHGVTGFVIDEPSEVTAIADVLRTLAGDEALRARVGAAAAAAMADHSWDRVADRTMAVYEDTLERR